MGTRSAASRAEASLTQSFGAEYSYMTSSRCTIKRRTDFLYLLFTTLFRWGVFPQTRRFRVPNPKLSYSANPITMTFLNSKLDVSYMYECTCRPVQCLYIISTTYTSTFGSESKNSFSLARARDRWEQLYFSWSVISANLQEQNDFIRMPFYWNQGGDIRLSGLNLLENRVPSESWGSSRRYNRALCTSFKQNRLRSWAPAICKRAKCPSCLIREASKKSV